MVIPHFGDYIAFKLDPVASLKYLKDPEVTKACEALKTTVYVACVTHVRLLPACRGSPSTNLFRLPALLFPLAWRDIYIGVHDLGLTRPF